MSSAYKKTLKASLAYILTLTMLLGMFPMNVLAQTHDEAEPPGQVETVETPTPTPPPTPQPEPTPSPEPQNEPSEPQEPKAEPKTDPIEDPKEDEIDDANEVNTDSQDQAASTGTNDDASTDSKDETNEDTYTLYNITFVFPDGKEKEETVKAGDKVDEPDFDPEGFLGWFEKNEDKPFDFKTAIDRDYELFAIVEEDDDEEESGEQAAIHFLEIIGLNECLIVCGECEICIPITINQMFTVTYYDWDGTTVVHTEEVEYGKDAVESGIARANVSQPNAGYILAGWSHPERLVSITEDVSVGMTLDLITYTINLNLAGGSYPVSQITYTIEDTIRFTLPTRANWAFVGWRLTTGTVNHPLPVGSNGNVFTIPAGIIPTTANNSITLTAQWTEHQTDLGFAEIQDDGRRVFVGRRFNGQHDVAYFIQVFEGDYIVNAANPLAGPGGTNTGNVSGAGYTIRVSTRGNEMTGTILYVTVAYDPNIHGNWTLANHTHPNREVGTATPSEPPNIASTHPGYTFGGWTPTRSPTVTGGVTYVAIWEEVGNITYYVNYFLEGTDTPVAPQRVVPNQVFNRLITENAIDIPGYLALEPTSQEFRVDISGSVNNIINFYYQANSYYVTYYVDDVLTHTDGPFNYDTLQQVRAAHTIPGYTVTAWATTDVTVTDGAYTMPANDVVFTATSSINSYTISYYVDGELVGQVETAEFNSPQTVRPAHTIEGYTVTAWATTDVTVTDGAYTMPANDVVFTATSTVNWYDYYIFYFTDSIHEDNFIVLVQGRAPFGATIGASEDDYITVDLTWEAPDGFIIPGVIDTTQFNVTSIGISDNFVDVVYTRDTFGYEIRYYIDSVDDDNFLDSVTDSATFGDSIGIEQTNDIIVDDTLFAPDGFVVPGTVSGITEIGHDSADNIVNVVYTRDTFEYEIRYYIDSIDDDNFLDNVTDSATFGDSIGIEQTNDIIVDDTLFAPAGFVVPGAVSGITVIGYVNADNVVNVVYTRDTFEYEIRYYIDSIDDDNFLDNVTGTATFGDSIGIGGTNDIIVDDTLFAPAGYFIPGMVSGITEIGVQNNVVYVVYSELPNITIFYVSADTSEGTVAPPSESLAPATGEAEGSLATANPGFHFINWTYNGAIISNDERFIPEKVEGLNVAATYTANFAEDGDITIEYLAGFGGTVSPAFESLAPATGIAEGSIAAANPGFVFVNWTDAQGIEVSEDPNFVPEKVEGLNVAATYTANFEADSTMEIILAAPSDTFVYAGVLFSLGTTAFTASALPAGFEATASTFGAASTTVTTGVTNAVNSDSVVITYPDALGNRVNVTKMFEDNIELIDGVLVVNPRPITVASGSATMVETGATLRNTATRVSAGSLPTGQTMSAVVTGARSTVGSSSNTIDSVTIRDAGGAVVTPNFTIGLAPGTLTITAPAAAADEPDEPDEPDVIIEETVPPLVEAPPTPEPPAEEEEEEEEILLIEDEEVPLAGPLGAWALWNLILSIAGAALAIMLGIRVLIKRKQRKEEGQSEENDEEQKRSRLPLMLAVPLLAIVAFIIFFLTQDMSQPMIMIDWWTLAHAGLFLGGILSYIFAYKREKHDDTDNQQPAGQATPA